MSLRLILKPLHRFNYVTAHSPTLPPLYLRHSSFYSPSVVSPTSQALHLGLRHSSFSNPSAASYTPQLILQPFRCFTYVTGTSRTSPGEPPMHRGIRNSVWWTSLLQQVTKFRSSYSFGELLRILLRAGNLFSFSHIVYSDSSFNIHNALYFVKYPSRAARNSAEGRKRPAGRGLKTPAVCCLELAVKKPIVVAVLNFSRQIARRLCCLLRKNQDHDSNRLLDSKRKTIN